METCSQSLVARIVHLVRTKSPWLWDHHTVLVTFVFHRNSVEPSWARSTGSGMRCVGHRRFAAVAPCISAGETRIVVAVEGVVGFIGLATGCHNIDSAFRPVEVRDTADYDQVTAMGGDIKVRREGPAPGAGLGAYVSITKSSNSALPTSVLKVI